MRTQTKLLLAIPVCMGIGFGVTYWLQLSKLKAEWAAWVPVPPAGQEAAADPAITALEDRVRAGEFEALAELAEAYAEAERFDQARTVYETLTGLLPDRLDWWMDLAALRLLTGEPREAKAALRHVRESGLDNGEDYLRLAVLTEQAGDQVTARDDYQRAVSYAPGPVPAWLRLIELHSTVGDQRAAREVLAQALVAHPESLELRLASARAARQRGRWDLALADYEFVRERQPEETELWYASAQALFELNRFEEGKALLDERLAADPADVMALSLLCVEAIAMSDRAEADRLLARLHSIGRLPTAEWTQFLQAYEAAFGEAPTWN